MFRKYQYLLCLLLVSCSSTQSWRLDAIQAGDQTFNCAKLVYIDPKSAPLNFEIICQGTVVEAFLYLSKHKLTPPSDHPQSINIEFTIDDQQFCESAPLLEGRMRIRLPQEVADKLILALQEGKKIDILLDGFQQRLNPDCFPKLYAKLVKPTDQLTNRLKGLFE